MMPETTLTAILVHDDDGHDVTVDVPTEAADEDTVFVNLRRRSDGAEYTLMLKHEVALVLIEQLTAAVRTSGALELVQQALYPNR